MKFSEIPGHESIKQSLIRAAKSGRISHSLLFHGPEGNGALLLAIAFTQYVSCEDRKEDDSCGLCKSCQKYAKLIHPDQHFVFPTMKMEDRYLCDHFLKEWREQLLESPFFSQGQWFQKLGDEKKQGTIYGDESQQIIQKLNLKPYESEFKTMIIWIPERLNLTSGNKLLKMLEEPPHMTLFVLVAESLEPILPTILSRCQLVRIPPLDDHSMQTYLTQHTDKHETLINNSILLSSGNMVKALSLLDEEADQIGPDFLDGFIALMRLTYSRDRPGLMNWSQEQSRLFREKQKAFLAYCLRMIRESSLMTQGAGQVIKQTPAESDFTRKFHPFIHEKNVEAIAAEFESAIFHLERNGNAAIIFLDLALTLIPLVKK